MLPFGEMKQQTETLVDLAYRNLHQKRNAKALRNSTSFKHVFIAPDLTPQERLHNKQPRAELTRHKESGETNLIIRHGQLIKRTPIKAAAPQTIMCFIH